MQTIKTFERVESGNIQLASNKNVHKDDSLVEITLDFINDCLKASVNPVCLCSFGKDSLVMLHLILRIKKIPVIYWREPFFQKKFSHPQKVSEDWDLEVYDYPPNYCDYLQIDDYFDVYNFYQTGTSWVNLYTGCVDYQEDKPFLCAIRDLLQRPKVQEYQFKWDCIFHGHKQCDPVYITDEIKLPKIGYDMTKITALPIRDWSNQDIWDYIHRYNLPYNKERYDSFSEERNNDMFRTCHNCLDYRNQKPYCPVIKKNIPPIGKSKESHVVFKNNLLSQVYK